MLNNPGTGYVKTIDDKIYIIIYGKTLEKMEKC